MNKAIKYRLYPKKTQASWTIQNIGCCRFVYDQALGWRKAAYDADGTSLTYSDTAYGLTRIKQMYPWLKDADSASLQQELRHLDTAYVNFFRENARFPKFKSRKHSRMSYTTPMNGNSIIVGSSYIKLPKLGKVKAVIHRTAPAGWKIVSATVSMDPDGTFWCSILYECDDAVSPVQAPELNAVGIDYKSDGLGYLSTGEVIGSPKKTQAYEKRLARAQRKLSRKRGAHKGELMSSNFRKQQARVARIHRKIANSRLDYLHKASLSIAKRYDLVGVEDIDMRSVAKHGSRRGKATMDNGFGTFRRLLEYKLHDRGKVFIKVDRWLPSSQRCSCCGTIHKELKDLSIRKWTCPDCGASHDRDHNAAINIRDEAIRVYMSQAV